MKKIFNFLLISFPFLLIGQTSTHKEVNEQFQTWVSLNSVTKFNEHWGAALDLHVRGNGLYDSDNFNLIRGGIAYFPNAKVSITAGYAHMWLAPTKEGWTVYADENRIYEQIQLSSKIGKVNVLQRLRNEQRWQEIMINDHASDKLRFSNRVRYLASFTIPVFSNIKLPSLVLSDELLINFGDDIVYNTFDQNRLFVGIKQNINSNWSFDFGYMNVYQQKLTGYQYDMNHTLRLFFYLNTKLKHSKSLPPAHHSGDE